MTTDTATLTDAQIETLLDEAAAAGDYDQAAVCERALEGDEGARGECARVISEARAQQD